MGELEKIWTNLLDQASLTAIESGRVDVADYLRLKLANDTIRRSGVDWLFQTLIDQALAVTQKHRLLKIERISPHSFKIGMSNMVGSKIEIQCGVRCLSLEAGWVRTPSDGIMHNGALANARISHFGLPMRDAEYRLMRGASFPIWIDEAGSEIHTDELSRQMEVLVDLPAGFAP